MPVAVRAFSKDRVGSENQNVNNIDYDGTDETSMKHS
jgi:hypothetical protein